MSTYLLINPAVLLYEDCISQVNTKLDAQNWAAVIEQFPQLVRLFQPLCNIDKEAFSKFKEFAQRIHNLVANAAEYPNLDIVEFKRIACECERLYNNSEFVVE